MQTRFGLCSLLFAFGLSPLAFGAELSPKPIPRVQVVPLPHNQFTFERDGKEITRYHYDPADKRPFLFPLNGPSGHTLTRMGHPHDPFTHSHHNSFWVAHHEVNGLSFWGDSGPAQMRHIKVEEFVDGDEMASATVHNSWGDTNRVFLWEYRRMTLVALSKNESLLLLDLRLEPNKESVTFGKTSFGLVAVRMAKSIGVHDGGGTIRSSESGVNEAGVHWKKARWVDYSGAIAKDVIEGITLFDHPANPNHPSVFHVRDDGWMGSSLTYDDALVVPTNKPLQLRYGLYLHRGLPGLKSLDQQWNAFTNLPIATFISERKKAR